MAVVPAAEDKPASSKKRKRNCGKKNSNKLKKTFFIWRSGVLALWLDTFYYAAVTDWITRTWNISCQQRHSIAANLAGQSS